MFDITSEIKKDYIAELLKSGKRTDGRAFDEYRKVTVENGASENADGSAMVRIGDTCILVGVKMGVGEPFPDMPNSGVLTTNAELRPIASSTFEKGPPGEDTIELARVVDRGVRESKCLDLEKLCIREGELVWIVFIDAHVLDYNGNLFDAFSLGAISALMDTKFPKLEDDKVIYKEKTNKKLPILCKPIETTFAKIDSSIILDPTLDEELVADARFTVATDEKGTICAIQKGGSGTFIYSEIMELVDRGAKFSKDLRKLLR